MATPRTLPGGQSDPVSGTGQVFVLDFSHGRFGIRIEAVFSEAQAPFRAHAHFAGFGNV
jgi:hypothetical protein